MNYEQFMKQSTDICDKLFGKGNWTIPDSFDVEPDFRMDFSTEWCEGGIEFVSGKWSIEFRNLEDMTSFFTHSSDLEGELSEPEYYLRANSGDLIIINWIQNRPMGENWVKISKNIYDTIYNHYFPN